MTAESRVAWITGGGTGIGKALTQALYRQGWKVVISGRRQHVLDAALQEIQTPAPGMGALLAMPGDASNPADIDRVVRSVHQSWGEIHLLINNAGENPYHPFDQAKPEEYEQYFRINCMSAIRCTQAVLPQMRARKSGAIVNVSSILGRVASHTSPAYTVSKFAMTGFTEVLRQELEGTGIHVMGVYPGFIRTAMTLPFVRPGSPRSYFGKSPESLAEAILRGLRRKKRAVLFPWYVPFAVDLHQLFPDLVETLRKRFGR